MPVLGELWRETFVELLQQPRFNCFGLNSGSVMKSLNETFGGIVRLLILASSLMPFFLGSLLLAQEVPPKAGQLAASIGAAFNEPYVDVDEWRDRPIRHRYVHGGFKGTEAHFSFYFPPKDEYRGHFFQHVAAFPMDENQAQSMVGVDDRISFAILSGAYLIDTNEGGWTASAEMSGYKVNAAAALYSKTVASEMYGPHRIFGYAYGGGGGSFKTISGAENTNVWDGAVPYVIGSPVTIPNYLMVRLHAMRVLWSKFPTILDNIETGGSGNMYAGLNGEERDTLREATRMGFPPAGWYNYKTLGQGSVAALLDFVSAVDPTYFKNDFWTLTGYEGANPPPSLLQARVQFGTKVKNVVLANEKSVAIAGAPVAVELESVPKLSFDGAYLIFSSGTAAGKRAPITKIDGNSVIVTDNSFGKNSQPLLSEVKSGDRVEIDNSDFLAFQTYYRHQVPSADFYVWDQFRRPDGKPILPQRGHLVSPMITMGTAGSLQSGKFNGKMIVVECMMDQDAFPWQADWYRSKVEVNLGDRLDDRFRLWYVERAIHEDTEKQEDPNRTVSYLGIVYQALLDLSAWVEKGVRPPDSTSYRIQDGQVMVPNAADLRKGVQPVVRLTANGGLRADIAVGQSVNLSAIIDVPRGAGKIISAEWDFDGTGKFALKQGIKQAGANTTENQVKLSTVHAFSKPGTYYVALRATSQRDAETPFASFTCIHNLGRVRVVVK